MGSVNQMKEQNVWLECVTGSKNWAVSSLVSLWATITQSPNGKADLPIFSSSTKFLPPKF